MAATRESGRAVVARGRHCDAGPGSYLTEIASIRRLRYQICVGISGQKSDASRSTDINMKLGEGKAEVIPESAASPRRGYD